MEAKTKHLEFILTTINRMAQNSYLLKGWSVTVVGGLIAFGFKESAIRYFVVSIAILFFFWLMDSYYLSRERRFVKLFDKVRQQDEAQVDFSMDTDEFGKKARWVNCGFSTTMIVFYGGLLLVHLISILIVM